MLAHSPSPDQFAYREANMATSEATIHPSPAQGRVALTITSQEISRYAEFTLLISQLEAQQKTLRIELLELRAGNKAIRLLDQAVGSPWQPWGPQPSRVPSVSGNGTNGQRQQGS
jgi:hypothetical protein